MADTKKRLRNQCDRLLQECALLKYGEKCEICPGTFRVGGHHIFSKSQYGFLRFDLDNIARLCSGCHIIKLHSQADPLIMERIKAKRGQRWWKELCLKVTKRPLGTYLTTEWYKSNLEALEKTQNKLENND